jgi:uncharacterized protein DUF6883
VRLPGFEKARIEPEKLHGYLLSDSHPVGRLKSDFFRSLGFRRTEWPRLEASIRTFIARHKAVAGEDTPYGRKYVDSGRLDGPAGRSARVKTVWIVLRGEALPRFVTAYPETGR